MSKGREIKPHIGIFGRRNNGKSSLINALAGQDFAIVSETPGTTTDPVKKSIELPGIGPAIVIDTAGIDDVGELGNLRVQKTRQIIGIIDFAIIVINANEIGRYEEELIAEFRDHDIPFIFVHNKNDLAALSQSTTDKVTAYNSEVTGFVAINRTGTEPLLDLIRRRMPSTAYHKPTLLGDLVKQGDIVLLITPIDIEAPEGRLILPQVQAIRDILDNDCVSVVLKERETDAFLRNTKIKPALVICDTSVILKADAMIPKEISLTGFSILLARHKGDFAHYLQGTPQISKLKDGDKVLMLESCTHHVSCDDIGRVKIPRWISQFTGKKLEYYVVAGLDKLPNDIREYALVVQCGGCMITRKQIHSRLRIAIDAGVPVTNYGMAIAYVQGVYNRAIAPFVKNADESYL